MFDNISLDPVRVHEVDRDEARQRAMTVREIRRQKRTRQFLSRICA